MQSEKKQEIQAAEYSLPYHYIPRYSKGFFSQALNLSWGLEYLSYVNFVLGKLKLLKFDSLLDVGCGDGRFLSELKKEKGDCNLYGIDIEERAVSFARALNPDINFSVGDIGDRNAFKIKFDVISLIEVLEHIVPESVDDFMSSINYLLKDNGLLVITVPSNNVKVRRKHYQHFYLSQILEIIKPYFFIEETYFLNKICFRSKMLHKIMTNGFFLLNSKYLLKKIYSYYTKALLIAEENNAKRLCIYCRRR